MKHGVLRLVIGAALVSGLTSLVQAAEETETKPLPTLLIKGEVESVDANDPSAVLVKVKDRYGFVTPIFVTPEASVTQGEEAAAAASLTTGMAVEVEYNFDVNTAKRHAVSVKIAAPTPTAAASPAVPAPAPETPADVQVVEPAAVPEPADAAAAEENTTPAP